MLLKQINQNSKASQNVPMGFLLKVQLGHLPAKKQVNISRQCLQLRHATTEPMHGGHRVKLTRNQL